MSTVNLLPLERLTDPDSLAVGYRQRGIPARISQAGELLLWPSDNAHAVRIPVESGPIVRRELRISLYTGPVIEGPGSWWTFIAAPDRVYGAGILEELATLNITVRSLGEPVLLPSAMSAVTAAGCRWVQPPGQAALPPLSAVIWAARHVSRRDTTQ